MDQYGTAFGGATEGFSGEPRVGDVRDAEVVELSCEAEGPPGIGTVISRYGMAKS